MGLFRRVITAFLVAALVAPATAFAQQADPTSSERTEKSEKKDPADLPVSLDRIRRQLVTPTRSTGSKDGLKIHYYIEVYGRAPKIDLFTPTDNLTSAPVMYGGMTHQEFLNLVTPQEFRAPAADIPAAIAALLKWATKQKAKSDK